MSGLRNSLIACKLIILFASSYIEIDVLLWFNFHAKFESWSFLCTKNFKIENLALRPIQYTTFQKPLREGSLS